MEGQIGQKRQDQVSVVAVVAAQVLGVSGLGLFEGGDGVPGSLLAGPSPGYNLDGCGIPAGFLRQIVQSFPDLCDFIPVNEVWKDGRNK